MSIPVLRHRWSGGVLSILMLATVAFGSDDIPPDYPTLAITTPPARLTGQEMQEDVQAPPPRLLDSDTGDPYSRFREPAQVVEPIPASRGAIPANSAPGTLVMPPPPPGGPWYPEMEGSSHPGRIVLPLHFTHFWGAWNPPPEETPHRSEMVAAPTEERTWKAWLEEDHPDLWKGMCCCVDNVTSDFIHMYTGERLMLLGLGVAAVAPLANTSADENFSRWYQQEIRSSSTNNGSRVVKPLGDYRVMVPLYVGAAALSCWADDCPSCGVIGEWGRRTCRAMMVGAPAVGLLQYGLGGGRPDEGTRWSPFNDHNSVAGHGFIASVPFLTAASMCKNPCGKAAFLAGSFLGQWSRFNDDSHSLSQVMLGWWIAYLAVESVTQTEMERTYFFVPGCAGADVGGSVVVQY